MRKKLIKKNTRLVIRLLIPSTHLSSEYSFFRNQTELDRVPIFSTLLSTHILVLQLVTCGLPKFITPSVPLNCICGRAARTFN